MDTENKFRFLTEEEFEKSKIFDDYETNVTATDFTILLGLSLGYGVEWLLSEFCNDYYYDYFSEMKKYRGYTRVVRSGVVPKESSGLDSFTTHFTGVRPVLSSSLITKINDIESLENGILEVECFSYPKNIVSSVENDFLEQKYKNGELLKTGKKYTINTVKYDDLWLSNFIPKKLTEYEYDGCKYIRYKADKNIGEILSDGSKIKKDKIYYVKVEKVKFLIDFDLDFAITKDIIFTGVRFNKKKNLSEFEKSEIFKFINKVLAKELISNEIEQKIIFGKSSKNEEIKKEERNYIKSVNNNDKTKIKIELCGYKNDIIEELKKFDLEKVDLNLVEDKPLVRSRGHYGYRK